MGGTGTRPGEDTNNAKYWAEHAEAVAGGDFATKVEAQGYVTAHNENVDAHHDLRVAVAGSIRYDAAQSLTDAQKAQAGCTRSFALGTHKHTDSGYDLCNTTNCQVYLGAGNATSESDAAVNATAGETLTYEGKEVIGYFFSSDGGATEDAANVWGG